MEAVAQLEAVNTGLVRNHDEIERQLEARIVAEFQDNSDVAALVNQIRAAEDQIEKPKRETRAESTPAVVSSQKQLDDLKKKFAKLWSDLYPHLRQRLIDEDNGMFSQAKIRELEAGVETASKKKLALAQYIEKMRVERKAGNHDTFEAEFLIAQVNSLMKVEEQFQKNLQQLEFDAAQDTYRVGKVDPAVAPKIPTDNNRALYMETAPVAVLFLILSLFLVHEIKAGRAARSLGRAPAHDQSGVPL